VNRWELHAAGIDGLAPGPVVGLLRQAFVFSTGLESAKMIGRSSRRDIASTTSRENSLPTVLTPMRMVGLRSSTAAAICGHSLAKSR
jgi:hypothetical protein